MTKGDCEINLSHLPLTFLSPHSASFKTGIFTTIFVPY